MIRVQIRTDLNLLCEGMLQEMKLFCCGRRNVGQVYSCSSTDLIPDEKARYREIEC